MIGHGRQHGRLSVGQSDRRARHETEPSVASDLQSDDVKQCRRALTLGLRRRVGGRQANVRHVLVGGLVRHQRTAVH